MDSTRMPLLEPRLNPPGEIEGVSDPNGNNILKKDVPRALEVSSLRDLSNSVSILNDNEPIPLTGDIIINDSDMFDASGSRERKRRQDDDPDSTSPFIGNNNRIKNSRLNENIYDEDINTQRSANGYREDDNSKNKSSKSFFLAGSPNATSSRTLTYSQGSKSYIRYVNMARNVLKHSNSKISRSGRCLNGFRFLLSGLSRLFRRQAKGELSIYFAGIDLAALRTEEQTGIPSTVQAETARIAEASVRLRTVGQTWAMRSSPDRTGDGNQCENHKYSAISFLPVTLYQQFRYFFNLFYLVVGLSQLFPQLQIGPLFTYLVPLAFVVMMSLIKEAIDDLKRRRRDNEVNSQLYSVVRPLPTLSEWSSPDLETEQLNFGCTSSDSTVPATLTPNAFLMDTSGTAGGTSTLLELPQTLARESTALQIRDYGLVVDKVSAAELRVGQVLQLNAGDRAPCDLVFLKGLRTTSGGNAEATDNDTKKTDEEKTMTDFGNSTFVKTDQLDGETDWKLRKAVHSTQATTSADELFGLQAVIELEPPKKDIYSFSGVLHLYRSESQNTFDEHPHHPCEQFPHLSHVASEPLSLENSIWTNSIITSGPILALAVYTGKYTRAAMHTSKSRTKIAKSDLEVNSLAKLLFGLLVFSAFMLVFGSQQFGSLSFIYFVRFVLILSSIIPISLRINLDMAKVLYSYGIARDTHMPGTVVRNSNIPEELGRIDLLFSDKTGTITQNRMEFKKMALNGRVINVVSPQFQNLLQNELIPEVIKPMMPFGSTKPSWQWSLTESTAQLVLALAITHSVTPAEDPDTNEMTFQASSPDEMALVKFASRVGFDLVSRTDSELIIDLKMRHQNEPSLTTATAHQLKFQILHVFPFSSANKCMSIIFREVETQQIYFYIKGADTVVLPCIQQQPGNTRQWFIEECADMGRQGLRILAFARKQLSLQQYKQFDTLYSEAKTRLVDREESCRSLVKSFLQTDLTILGLTGVEDDLQEDVAHTVETLQQSGITVWMLTGDKVETALCIAASAGFKSRQDTVVAITEEQYEILGVKDLLERLAPPVLPSSGFHPADSSSSFAPSAYGRPADAGAMSSSRYSYLGRYPSTSAFLTPANQGLGDSVNLPDVNRCVLCVDGVVLGWCLENSRLAHLFVQVAMHAKSVICSRCSPTQKCEIVKLVKYHFPQLTVAAIGDGGNDVPMIQAADCGIGIVGHEGRQASLAADFAISGFRHVKRLFLWHGRMSYFRSSKLALFVIHRGLLIAVIQIILSVILYFTPIALFQGWLQIGYSTYYTMFPVFSLVWDVELTETITFLFPELYGSGKTVHPLGYRAFFETVFKAIFQGSAIMIGVLFLFEKQMTTFVAITFTALVLSELLNVTSEINKWHVAMLLSQCLSLMAYALSIFILSEYFDPAVILTLDFWWKVVTLTIVSWLPTHLFKVARRLIRPPQYAKLVD